MLKIYEISGYDVPTKSPDTRKTTKVVFSMTNPKKDIESLRVLNNNTGGWVSADIDNISSRITKNNFKCPKLYYYDVEDKYIPDLVIENRSTILSEKPIKIIDDFIKEISEKYPT